MLHSHNQRLRPHSVRPTSAPAPTPAPTYTDCASGSSPSSEVHASSSASTQMKMEEVKKGVKEVETAVAGTSHPLLSEWTLWCHLPFRTNQDDWTIGSYKNVYTFSTLEEVVASMETMPDKFFLNSVLFLMRKGTSPMWEDKTHRKGGYFSFKVPNKHVGSVARQLAYAMVGETLGTLREFNRNISGLSISPKKGSCTIKVWMCTAEYQSAQLITAPISNLSLSGCIFGLFDTAIETNTARHANSNVGGKTFGTYS